VRFVVGCKPGEVEPGSKGRRVAIIGAGPAGLAAAGYLTCRGYNVEVYDMMPEPGGLMVFGVYDKRLPRENVRRGVEELRRLGVIFRTRVRVGKDVDLEDLISSYDALLIATGTWATRRLRIPGSELAGVYGAQEYIADYYLWRLGYRNQPPPIGGNVVVIGGGLTAVDACYIALDLGAKEVHLVYRRTRREAPAGEKEFQELERKGVIIHELTSPVEYIGSEGKLKAVKLIKMGLGEPDESGRPRPIPVPGTEHTLDADIVLEAVGLHPTPPFREGKDYGIKLNPDGIIYTDECYRTTREPVFAAGDVKHGPSLIGLALRSGYEAAKCIEAYLEGKIGWINQQ